MRRGAAVSEEAKEAVVRDDDDSADDDSDSCCCWICYERGDSASMLRPCNCRGSMEHVHGDCLLKWLMVNTPGHGARLRCPHCLTPYRFKPASKKGTDAAADAAAAQLEREQQPWPVGCLLPVRRRLDALDAILAEETAWRLRAAAAAALPALVCALASLVVLLEAWRRQAADEGKTAGTPRQLPRTALDRWLARWGGAAFEDDPQLDSDVGVGHVWAWAFRNLQAVSTYCGCAAIVLNIVGWHGFVDWSTAGHLRGWRWRVVRRARRGVRFLLCVNLPLPRLVRVVLVNWLLRALRPWRVWHARAWHIAYRVFDSRVEVALSTAQTVYVLLMWLAAWHHEWCRARRQIRCMFRLKKLGTLQIANHDDDDVISADDSAAANAMLAQEA